MRRIGTVLVALSGLAGSSRTATSQAVAPQIIRAAREHVRPIVEHHGVRGPVLVNVASFVTVLREDGSAQSSGAVLEAGGPGARSADRRAAVVCRSGVIGCRVVDNGVYIQLDSASTRGDSLVALVQVLWTDRRPSGATATGSQFLRFTFVRQGRAWEMSGPIRVLRQS
jgi:hypothetical protein